jgi:FkbM family methyltransferase
VGNFISMQSFISYAQNFEDVILWRALKQIEKGVYVDVGAQDPEVESVTRAFYERGWSGINIEPVDEYFNKLSQSRPRDTNLKVAVGRESGLRTLYSFPGTGLSTFDSAISARHQAAGLTPQETNVQVLTLTQILQDSAAPTIHFLKIDVEGAEDEVLEGLDLDRIRPWIIVVEATEPNSPVVNHEKWEYRITDRGFEFAYFDGLNCYYVANEVAELKGRLAIPPNFFDHFIRASEWVCSQRAETLQQQAETLQQQLVAEQNQKKEQIEALQQQLVAEQNQKKQQIEALQQQLVAEQAQKNFLLGRIHQLAAQLAVPSVDRFLGRVLARVRDRFSRRSFKP